jgi:hypothetical protein
MYIKVISTKDGIAVDHDIYCNKDMTDEEALALARECNPGQDFGLEDVLVLRDTDPSQVLGKN